MARILVLGLSDYLRKFAFPGLANAKDCEFVGVATRNVDKARAALGVGFPGEIIGLDETLVHRPDIDAVYITLPNGLHVDWVLRAIEAGKHVLCEKPMALETAEVDRIQTAATKNNVTVMEGYTYRFHPQWTWVTEALKSGAIGDVTSVVSHYAYLKASWTGPRYQPELGGGILNMIGCYPISVALLAFGQEPIAVSAANRPAGATGVDVTTSAVMEFASGHAIVSAVNEAFDNQFARIMGSHGFIDIPTPFTAPKEDVMEVVVRTEDGEQIISAGPADQFQLEFEQFARVMHSDEAPLVSLKESRRGTRAIQAIAASADHGGVRVEL